MAKQTNTLQTKIDEVKRNLSTNELEVFERILSELEMRANTALALAPCASIAIN
jgi:hypothetical protein